MILNWFNGSFRPFGTFFYFLGVVKDCCDITMIEYHKIFPKKHKIYYSMYTLKHWITKIRNLNFIHNAKMLNVLQLISNRTTTANIIITSSYTGIAASPSPPQLCNLSRSIQCLLSISPSQVNWSHNERDHLADLSSPFWSSWYNIGSILDHHRFYHYLHRQYTVHYHFFPLYNKTSSSLVSCFVFPSEIRFLP